MTAELIAARCEAEGLRRQLDAVRSEAEALRRGRIEALHHLAMAQRALAAEHLELTEQPHPGTPT